MNLPKFLSVLRNQLITVGLVSLIAGAIIILAIRFITYHPESTHYHANFAIYIDGQRQQFKSPSYYEEVGNCSIEEKMTPHERAHMHDGVNNVVHVHDHAVSWGQFFQNLGWVIDPKLIQARNHLYIADRTHKITFILNGQATDNLVNREIGDRDRLLVDYGNTYGKTLNHEYKSVPSTAAKYDASKDSASCGGSAPTTTHDRFNHLF